MKGPKAGELENSILLQEGFTSGSGLNVTHPTGVLAKETAQQEMRGKISSCSIWPSDLRESQVRWGDTRVEVTRGKKPLAVHVKGRRAGVQVQPLDTCLALTGRPSGLSTASISFLILGDLKRVPVLC